MSVTAGAGPSLEGLAVGVDHLDAIVVFAYGRGTPYAAWVRRGTDVDEREAASKAARLLEIVPEADTLMVESKRSFMMVHGLRSFGVAIVFAREVPLGFARMASRQIASTLEHELPFELPQPDIEIPRSVAPRSVAPADVVPPAIVVEPPRVEPPRVEPPRVEPPRVEPPPVEPPPVEPPPVEPPPVEPVRPASVAPPPVELPPVPAPEPPAMVDLAPPAIVEAPAVVEAPDAPVVLASTSSLDDAGPSTAISRQAVEARPTVPSTPPAPPQVDFDSDSGPDTAPPRSAVGHRVRAILTHIERNAPDGHIARLRIALRSGLGLEALVYPDDLSSEALVVIETAAEDILGVDHGKLGTLAPP